MHQEDSVEFYSFLDEVSERAGQLSGAFGYQGCVSGTYSLGGVSACSTCHSYAVSDPNSMVPTRASCICTSGYTAKNLVKSCGASRDETCQANQTTTSSSADLGVLIVSPPATDAFVLTIDLAPMGSH